MSPRLLSIDQIIEQLGAAPRAIREETDSLADQVLDRSVDGDQWSANEILAHLRASATIRGEQRIGPMLSEDEPTIRTISPRRWPGMAKCLAMTFHESLAAYVTQREVLLDRLRGLRPEAWQRGGTMTGLHAVRHETVQSEASVLVQHELEHLEQIRRQLRTLEGMNDSEK